MKSIINYNLKREPFPSKQILLKMFTSVTQLHSTYCLWYGLQQEVLLLHHKEQHYLGPVANVLVYFQAVLYYRLYPIHSMLSFCTKLVTSI